MKLHLPVSLFRALLALFIGTTQTVKATVIQYPDDADYPVMSGLPFFGYSNCIADGYIACGGAILWVGLMDDGEGTLSILNNDVVQFSNNSAPGGYEDGEWYGASGGAIAVDFTEFCMNNNRSVTFNANYATFSGGAIWGPSSIMEMNNNGSVLFSQNYVDWSRDENNELDFYSASGGAIHTSSIEMNHNESVEFSDNSISGVNARAAGGAILAFSSFANNKSVKFTGNSATGSDSEAEGGAIAASGLFSPTSKFFFSSNETVLFSKNTVSSNQTAKGGAICGSEANSFMEQPAGDIELSTNGDLSFKQNSATSTAATAYGGALYGCEGGTITLSGNGTVEFCQNAVNGSSAAYGGAIYGDNITINGNSKVWFCGNIAKSKGDEEYGSAIYAAGNLGICNNDSVLFEKNVEKLDSGYHLRSICAGGGENSVSFSAPAGKKIEFLDSVYIGADTVVQLNKKYGEVEQSGDIVSIQILW